MFICILDRFKYILDVVISFGIKYISKQCYSIWDDKAHSKSHTLSDNTPVVGMGNLLNCCSGNPSTPKPI